jgi:pantothenate kinase
MSSPEMNLRSFPNPVKNITSIKYSVDATSNVKIAAFDIQGKLIKILVDKKHEQGTFETNFDLSNLAQGTYLIAAFKNGQVKQTLKVVKN